MSLDYLFCCLSAVLETRPGPLVIEEIWFIVIPPLPMPFNWAGYLVQEIISASLVTPCSVPPLFAPPASFFPSGLFSAQIPSFHPSGSYDSQPHCPPASLPPLG